jgi:hypothetical protein
MNEATVLEWLLQLRPIGVAIVLGLAPAMIARWKRRRMTPWYLYGLTRIIVLGDGRWRGQARWDAGLR